MSIHIDESTGESAGESLYLSCRVLGAKNLNPSITYQWIKNNSSGQIKVGTHAILSFTPVRLSDAASYSCAVTIASVYLTNNITAMASHSVRIQSRLINSRQL